MARLDGKVVLVTGAQQGIGKAAAIEAAAAGADVAVNWLDDRAAADAVADAVRGHGRKAALIQGDVGTAAGATALVQAAIEQMGRVDHLVNNAGVFPRVKFLDMTERDWDHVIDINLRGTFFCTQAMARALIAAGRPGAVVNLASQAIRGSSPRGVHYVASKGGVVSMTRALALELAPQKIRVNAVAPGLIDTAQPRYGSSEEELQAAGKLVPIGHMGEAADIAHMIVYLLSDKARYVTGQTMHVNGGNYMP